MDYPFSGKSISKKGTSIFAVAIFLPRELDELISPIRERFDPDYDICASHITLVFPFESSLPLDELAAGIREGLENARSFEIELDSIGDFYPKAPVIYWQVQPAHTLNKLYKSLYARLDIPLPHRELIPHVTVAREISHHRVMLVKERIVPYLPKEKFSVQAVDLISPLANHRWVSVRTFALPE